MTARRSTWRCTRCESTKNSCLFSCLPGARCTDVLLSAGMPHVALYKARRTPCCRLCVSICCCQLVVQLSQLTCPGQCFLQVGRSSLRIACMGCNANLTGPSTASHPQVGDLSAPQLRFKVDVNARENHMSGASLALSGTFALVVVEGTEKTLRRCAGRGRNPFSP